MNHLQKHLTASLIALSALLSTAWAQAATAPDLKTAANFAVLSAAPSSGGAVTTTGSAITGNVGSSGAVTLTDSTITGNVVYTSAFTNTGSTISGTTTSPLDSQVVTDFNTAYGALSQPCTNTINTAAFTDTALSVSSGVTCFPAAVTFTRTVLTLTGSGPWILRTGTGSSGTGALTGTNLTVVMANGGNACNVFWQVAAAASMTDSLFEGNILASAAISMTRGTLAGRALAGAGVTMTGTSVIGCDAALPGGLVCVVTPPPKLSCDTNHQHHKNCKLHDYDPPHCDGNDDGHDGHDGYSSSPWSNDKYDNKNDNKH